MKIEIEIPEWAQERHIRIMAGMELLAYKPYGEDILYVKTSRCSMCGKCCTMLPDRFFLPTINGTCTYLQRNENSKVRECSLTLNRPFTCCVGKNSKKTKGLEDICSVEFVQQTLARD